MSEPVRVAVDVREVAPAGGECVVVDVFAPPPGVVPSGVLWWLLPGGGMSRRYWDLDVPGHSLARILAARGHVAVTVDHLGVGESSVPDDPYALTRTRGRRRERPRAGRGCGHGDLLPGRPGTVVGLGHSAGAGLLVTQQARHGGCDALALLGYGGRGMPEALDPDGRPVRRRPRRAARRPARPRPRPVRHAAARPRPAARPGPRRGGRRPGRAGPGERAAARRWSGWRRWCPATPATRSPPSTSRCSSRTATARSARRWRRSRPSSSAPAT